MSKDCNLDRDIILAEISSFESDNDYPFFVASLRNIEQIKQTTKLNPNMRLDMFKPFDMKSTDMSGWVVEPILSNTDINPRAKGEHKYKRN